MRRFPDADPGEPRQLAPGRYLLWLVRTQLPMVLLGAFYGILWPTSQALMPFGVGRAIDDGLTGHDRGDLLFWAGVVLALGVVQAAAAILQDRCALTNALGARYRTLQLVTRQAARLGATLPRKTSAGEVLSVGVADVTQIGRALDLSSRTIGAAASIAVIAAIMLATSWQLGLVVLAGVPVMVWAVALLLRPLHDRQARLRDQQAELTAQAVDIVGGLRVLRGIGGEELFGRRYDAESQRVRRGGVHLAATEAALEAARMLLPGLLVALIVFLGARQVLAGELTGGQLVAFYGYAVFLGTPVRRLVVGTGAIMKAYVAARRVVTLLALEPEIDPGGSARLDGRLGALADPASGLVAAGGRFTAVACASPGDAAVLADRLGRYAESDVTYGGVPLRSADVDDVRRGILVAGNDARLFAGPLRTELAADGVVDDARLLAALEVASAADVLEALPDGLDTVVTSGGKEFSGGQLQRLRLARAVLAAPDVLMLVEPTSAVDAHTEARIAERLATARAGRTTVVFATSPILLDHADQVVLVDDGAVVATGTHASLLDDPRYRALVAREEGGAA
ncbi:ABC transporter ATP-binding protein [Jiangella alkaliphila]|uniref:ABC-type multidrug transport system, ATPase and permease component n=1 Tax=Jiangella alkaliphila TaxID=419479 RepID=A0A1H2JB15_9ACTN|nr:ABC transporter ATP-binding protein [Jiangella alkaliphila]SDU53589.1 ABC-type multidrug transport system, ATPase and permease component [Jiangella alkaliphila]